MADTYPNLTPEQPANTSSSSGGQSLQNARNAVADSEVWLLPLTDVPTVALTALQLEHDTDANRRIDQFN